MTVLARPKTAFSPIRTTWRRPKPKAWVFDTPEGPLQSWAIPITSVRVWWRPSTWKVKVYPHTGHVHLAPIPPGEHLNHVHYVPASCQLEGKDRDR